MLVLLFSPSIFIHIFPIMKHIYGKASIKKPDQEIIIKVHMGKVMTIKLNTNL